MSYFSFVRTTINKSQRRKRLTQLLMLISFTITFIFVRIFTYLQRLQIIPNQTSMLHIHHLVPGIILLITTGYVGMSFWSIAKLRYAMAIFFGIGAALTIDEFALWVYLKDVYWEKQGRVSVDAVIVAIAILTISFLISEAHDHKWFKHFFGFKK